MIKSFKFGALGAAMVLALSACGGGDEGGGGGDPADVPLAQAPAQVQQYAALFNAARSQNRTCGSVPAPAVQPLTKWNPALQQAAQKHADDLSGRDVLTHTGADGSDVNSRSKAAGYNGFVVSENIAGGRGSPEAIMNAWMNSQGHCIGIMAGMANSVALAQNGKYTVMVFGD